MKNIRLGCATLVTKGDKVLLGRSNKKHIYGQLVVPGGGVEYGECFCDTSRREILEETGIQIQNIRQVGVYEIVKPDQDNHRVIIFCHADYKSGEIKASDDLIEAAFYTRAQIADEIKKGTICEVPLKMLRDSGWA